MAGYSARQSTITNGNTVLAADSNDEFNAILGAFNGTTGHDHSGGAGQGPRLVITAVTGGTDHGLFISNGSAVISSTAALTNGQVVVGSTGADPAPVSISGDATLNSAGALIITAGSVTLAKMADMATSSILGRTTASTGVPEVLSVATVQTLLNIENGATGDQTGAEIKALYEAEASAFTDTQFTKLSNIEASADVTDTANVTAAGALMDSEVDADIKTLVLPASTTISTFGASLIDDVAATNARTTLGLGSLATLSNVPDNEITLAMMAHGTDGNLITYDAAGAPAFVATGTATQVLTSNGAGAAPTMQDAASAAILHDLTSTSDVTLVVATGSSAANITSAAQVIATKASVALKTTDKLWVGINSIVLDGTSISITTVVQVSIRINSVYSHVGRDDNGTVSLSEIDTQRLQLNAVQVGTTDTYTSSNGDGYMVVLADDFISSDGNYTIDIVAGAQSGDDTLIVAGATATTVFKLRVEA